ncbi:transcription initiation factor IIF subunit alpha-like [Rosa rugosa]|uniref:transcription initiation factor IIF subunit alpha-like n=1 Tax=Rosa rugosa TaxID=74645 RepID=UPI002B4068AB|nr:transcription initiation factor IIF subunit alpha-like [Rosa rugosa]
MSTDLLLKPSCQVRGCGSTSDLYGSNCNHMTLCFSCGKSMAENKAKCIQCDAIVTRLIREYNVRRESTVNNKNYFIGRFGTGLPNFSKTKNPSQNKWSLRKDLQDPRKNKEEQKTKPWVLDELTGQSRYQGHQEGAQSASYYLLMKQGKEFSAVPAGSWFNFNKVAQYKQLTLEEAEEKMNNRQKTNRDGYKRWIMKFGNGPEKVTGDDGGGGEGNFSDNEEEETTRKRYRLGSLNKIGGDGDDDEDNLIGANEDGDLNDDGSDKGSDWEHEEIFSDDDEAVGNPDEQEDFEHEAPAPPETKQDDDGNEEEAGLTESGRELKKLLGRSGGLNGIDEEEEDEDDDDEDDMDEDIGLLPPAPKQKDAPKQLEPFDNRSTKPVTKGKRKLDSDQANKASNTAPPKKMKTENEQKSSVREKPAASEISVHAKVTQSLKTGSASPVSEEEIRALLMQKAPIALPDFVNNFPERRKYSKEQKDAFTAIVKKVSELEKKNGISYVVLRKK